MEKVVRVRTVGGTLVITIPKLVAEQEELEEGDYVRVRNEEEGTITIERIEEEVRHKTRKKK